MNNEDAMYYIAGVEKGTDEFSIVYPEKVMVKIYNADKLTVHDKEVDIKLLFKCFMHDLELKKSRMETYENSRKTAS